MWTEFKPAFKFLFIFLGLYLGGNVLYGIFIEWNGINPDPFTKAVAYQTATVLRVLGNDVTATINKVRPTVFLMNHAKIVLSIFEGCNGLNVMIVFISFLIAFAGSWKKMTWFLPLGILIVHLANIVRLALLYFVAEHYQRYFYYVHKYVFTAAIYFVVILLWIAWVTMANGNKENTSAA